MIFNTYYQLPIFDFSSIESDILSRLLACFEDCIRRHASSGTLTLYPSEISLLKLSTTGSILEHLSQSYLLILSTPIPRPPACLPSHSTLHVSLQLEETSSCWIIRAQIQWR